MSNMLFNNQGELNASSVKDALATIAKLASSLQENTPANTGLTSAQPDSRRDELISRAMMTQDGKLALAQAMANPIN